MKKLAKAIMMTYWCFKKSKKKQAESTLKQTESQCDPVAITGTKDVTP
ncbi:MAG: hypothetical protein V4714_02670 [Bacteroidota bacterium]